MNCFAKDWCTFRSGQYIRQRSRVGSCAIRILSTGPLARRRSSVARDNDRQASLGERRIVYAAGQQKTPQQNMPQLIGPLFQYHRENESWAVLVPVNSRIPANSQAISLGLLAPSALWGRLPLYSRRQASIPCLASVSVGWLCTLVRSHAHRRFTECLMSTDDFRYVAFERDPLQERLPGF